VFKITKEFNFSASHQLLGLPPDHPCARLHGHNYVVELELSSTALNRYGFVRDYGELDAFKKYIDEEIDHRHLNEVFGTDFVTAEFLAQTFFAWCRSRWPEITAVRVSETARTWAEYRP
jgi:6-pyruvoyltetrahydropterin/6-carboxytetrahydropterin synthase